MGDERETSPQCPECDGVGRMRFEDGTSYRESSCQTCEGTGLVTRTQLAAWRIRTSLEKRARERR